MTVRANNGAIDDRVARGLFVGHTGLGGTTVWQNLRAVADERRLSVEPISDHARGVYAKLPLPGRFRGGLSWRRDVLDLVRTTRPDYLIANPYMPLIFCHDLVARVPTALMLDATPVQFDALGYWLDRTDAIPGARAAKFRLVYALFQRAAAMLPMSNWAARSLIEDYDVPRERVFVTPPGVDTEFWSPATKRTSTTSPEIVFVGGDFERKGGWRLLEWYRREGRDRARLTFVTREDVPQEPGVRVVRAEPNTSELRDVVRNADIFALPTRADCTPHAIMEAMASGLPVIAGDVGGISDLVEDGVTGYLVRPTDDRAIGNALAALIESEASRRRMGAIARERAVRSLDTRRIADRVTAVGQAMAKREQPNVPTGWRVR